MHFSGLGLRIKQLTVDGIREGLLSEGYLHLRFGRAYQNFMVWLQTKSNKNEMPQELNWETLASRRKTARLSFMCKISHKLMDFSVAVHLKPNSERRTCGSHPFKFIVPRAKKDVFKFSFFPHTIIYVVQEAYWFFPTLFHITPYIPTSLPSNPRYMKLDGSLFHTCLPTHR